MSDIGPGDLVVCVDDSPFRSDGAAARPPAKIKRNAVYRVGSVGVWRGMPALTLVGVAADTESGAFFIFRFRKLHAPDTEISRQIRACRRESCDQPAISEHLASAQAESGRGG